MNKSQEELIQDLDDAIKADNPHSEREAAMVIMGAMLRDLNRIANASVIIATHLMKQEK